VTTAPQIEIAFEYMPGEQAGPIRSLPFDQMLVGTWSTREEKGGVPDNAPALQALMEELTTSVAAVPPVQVLNGKEVRYTDMYAELKIEDAQGLPGEPTLKQLTLGIHWDEQPTDPTNGQPGFFNYTFVSRDSTYSSGGD